MYEYIWDDQTGGILLTTNQSKFSKEPRPVYSRELDILGFNEYWNYPNDNSAPIMWAEANNYYYRGKLVAKTKGGSIYTKPEIIILDTPEPPGEILKFVDVKAMCEKNRNILETLVQETIQKIYNTYMEYRKKIDIYYVAFSGGKDSVVTLDLVQRALPHDGFLVLFGDTQMEFSDTYDVIDKTEEWCIQNSIRFLRAKSDYTPQCTWSKIGPPAQKMRWCCSVHKTAPQIILLREITKNPHFRGMAIMGVRADESVTRSKYEQLNLGTKHQGQYDFYPILEWNSAELFLYIFQEKLTLNETYKKGNSRAGCLVCPMEATKNSWFKAQSYSGDINDSSTTSFYFNLISELTVASEMPKDKYAEFMNIGVWKSRHNGVKLKKPNSIYNEEKKGKDYIITLDEITTKWQEWFKTIGDVSFSDNGTVSIYCNEQWYTIYYSQKNGQHIFKIQNINNSQKDINFVSWTKTVLKKSAYCIRCRVCEANCPHGFIHMENGEFSIDDSCIKCKKCYKINNGCVVAASQLLPKEINRMNGSIDQYKNMGIRYSWVVEYLEKKDNFWEDNLLGSQMINSLKVFLRHAGILDGKNINSFGEKIANLGGDTVGAWAIMLCNLVYTPQFNWWVNNIGFEHTYTQAEIKDMLEGIVTDNSKKNVISGFKNILSTNDILGKVLGLGVVKLEKKGKNNTTLVDVHRTKWEEPIPEVILYSLFKFAEACDGYYQFSLSTLMDDSIERDGISPSRMFGLDRDTMIGLLNNLSTHYPDFIRASFTLDLETITLSEDKSADDVLDLF